MPDIFQQKKRLTAALFLLMHLFIVLIGGHANVFFEHLAEIEWIIQASQIPDLPEAEMGGLNQLLGMMNPDLVHVAHDRKASELGEHPVDVVIIAFEAQLDFRADDLLGVVFMDVIQQCMHLHVGLGMRAVVLQLVEEALAGQLDQHFHEFERGQTAVEVLASVQLQHFTQGMVHMMEVFFLSQGAGLREV